MNFNFFGLHVMYGESILVPTLFFFAIERLVNENPTNAGQLILTGIENNRYMDDLQLTFDSVNDVKTISRESALLFRNRDCK